jgi:tetratricopeptide (TPR) repeat protein
MPIDLSALWDFSKPELSESRFRLALASASPDEALILQTQIARTYGLRGDFTQARQILAGIETRIQDAGAEARVRYFLELGRTHASELARGAYLRAFELAKEALLDDLAIDALHMMIFVDTTPDDQVEWNRKAIAYMEASSQPDAKKWAGSLHNNLGYALHLLHRFDEALLEFKIALAAREQSGNPHQIRIAHWMIAWTLRALGRLNEAIEIQLRLEKECDAAGEPDPYVFEELELLYQALKDSEKAEHYAALRKASG